MRKFLMISIIAVLTACSTQRFEFAQNKSTIPSYEGTSHFVFWGIGQTKDLSANEVCGSRGISAVETETSFVNGLLSTITYGIYSPESYAIYCKAPQN